MCETGEYASAMRNPFLSLNRSHDLKKTCWMPILVIGFKFRGLIDYEAEQVVMGSIGLKIEISCGRKLRPGDGNPP